MKRKIEGARLMTNTNDEAHITLSKKERRSQWTAFHYNLFSSTVFESNEFQCGDFELCRLLFYYRQSGGFHRSRVR